MVHFSFDVCQNNSKHYKTYFPLNHDLCVSSVSPKTCIKQQNDKTPNFSVWNLENPHFLESSPIFWCEGYTHNTTQNLVMKIQSWFHKDFSISSKVIWNQHLLLVEKVFLSVPGWWVENTFPETNIAPENKPSQKEMIVFQPSIFRCYVSLPKGMWLGGGFSPPGFNIVRLDSISPWIGVKMTNIFETTQPRWHFFLEHGLFLGDFPPYSLELFQVFYP